MTDPESDPDPVLQLRGITKSFGAIDALTTLDLDLWPGEVLAVVGDNGAGKSTLVKLVAGMHRASAGTLHILGREHAFTSAAAARRAGVEVVYQDLALVERQPVYMNLFLGREIVTRRVRRLDRSAMMEQSRQLLDDLGVHIGDVRRNIRELSGGQRQGVAISRAVHWAGGLVLLDEPTAALGVAETARVEGLIERMRDKKVAVVVVSHNLDQVFRLADRVLVLRQGQHVGTRAIADTSRNEIVSMITGLGA